jgi:hypothetical protein
MAKISEKPKKTQKNKWRKKVYTFISNPQFKKIYLPILIILSAFLMMITSIPGKSATSDESSHLVRGRLLLETFDYRLNHANPALFNAFQAIPTVFNKKIVLEDVDNSHDWDTADKNKIKSHWVELNGGKNQFAHRVLTAPRIFMMLFNSAFLFLFFKFIRQEFNFFIALVSTLLMAFSPTFLAHSRLVVTGVPVMWAIFLATIALYKYLNAKPKNRQRTYLLFLAASGFALQVKYTATLVAVAWIGTIFVISYLKNQNQKFFKRLWQSSKVPLLTIGCWFVILFVFYGFQIKTLKTVNYGADWRIESNTEHLQMMGEYINKVTPWNTNDEMLLWAYENIPVPFPQYINGFMENVLIHNYFWYGKYIFGQFYGPGHNIPYYFPVAFCVKETVPTVLLTLGSIGLVVYLSITQKLRLKKLLAKYHILIILPIFIAFLLLNSSINLGIRHLMPLYPYLFIAVGWSVYYVYQKLKKQVSTNILNGILVVLFMFSLVSIMRIHPDLIPYYNELAGGPQKGWWYVRGTNFDWNQDDGFVEKYIDKHNAVTDAQNLPDEGKGLYIARVKRLYGNHPKEELVNLRKLYENEEIQIYDNIHHTYWVFEVEKNQLLEEDQSQKE